METKLVADWLVTLISGVSSLNNYQMYFGGSAQEATDWALARLVEDAEGNSPEYQGFSLQSKVHSP